MTRGIGIDWNKSTCKWSLLEIAVYEVCVYIYIEINWVLNLKKKKFQMVICEKLNIGNC